MSAEYSVEEVLATAKWCRENSSGIYRKSAIAADMLNAYADTLSKPADSGRVVEDAICPNCERTTDIRHCRACGCDFRAALAAQGQGDDQAWDENAERLTREAGIGGGRVNPSAASMDDVFLPAPASPAGVPDGYVLVQAEVSDGDAFMVLHEYQQPGCTRKDAYRIAIRKLAERASERLAAAPSAPKGDGGAE